MSGLVARRNDSLYWQGDIEWVMVAESRKPVCDDCALVRQEARGLGAMDRATWRRVSDYTSTQLCPRHKGEWDTWTPGQLELL